MGVPSRRGWSTPCSPALAAIAVQGRLGLDEPVTWIAQWSLAPLLLAGAVRVVAEAFRRGERVSRDVEGLVYTPGAAVEQHQVTCPGER